MNWLVVGLGNIGPEYANTRHNMGFMVLDAWSQASGAVFSADRYASVAEVSVRGQKITLVKPSTFMNLSGKAVRYWMQEKNVPLERVVVICDDLNLPMGAIRMRGGGSNGGHNGLGNIEETLGTQGYPRLRIGIGNDFARGAQIDFVLGPLAEEQQKKMPQIAAKIAEELRTWAFMGIGRAMTNINTANFFE